MRRIAHLGEVGTRSGASGLRFDKVALRFVEDLQASLQACVPEGKTLVVTITAPIRRSSETTAELVERLRRRLARSPARLEFEASIEGNRIRARLVKARSAKVLGFVHNPDRDPELFLKS